MVNFINDNYFIYSLIITAMATGLCLTGMPIRLFKKIKNIHIASIMNCLFISLFCYLMIKVFLNNWNFGFTLKNLTIGIFYYGWPIILLSLIFFIRTYWLIKPLEKKAEKRTNLIVIIIQILFGVTVEEIIFRGVLLNALIRNLDIAILPIVIISSVMFGMTHLYGMSFKNISTIFKILLETICLGVFFSSVYVCSGNLLSVIILHFILNVFVGLLFNYYKEHFNLFPSKLFFIQSILLMIYGLYLICI